MGIYKRSFGAYPEIPIYKNGTMFLLSKESLLKDNKKLCLQTPDLLADPPGFALSPTKLYRKLLVKYGYSKLKKQN